MHLIPALVYRVGICPVVVVYTILALIFINRHVFHCRWTWVYPRQCEV